MEPSRLPTFRVVLIISLIMIITASSRLRADSGSCGGASTTLPFTDVMGNLFFCEIAEAFFSGLTNGTTPTTYSPAQNVPREQMSAFVTRTLDQSLKRGSRRAALGQFWTPTSEIGLRLTTVGSNPQLVESDGADVWVANNISGTVSRVRASDGKLLETWTDALSAAGVLVAKGLIFVTGSGVPGKLYQIDPTQPQGPVTTLTSALGDSPEGIAFDGARVWTANTGGSVSIVSFNPLSVTTVSEGFSFPIGIMFDGANMWLTDRAPSLHDPGKLHKLDANGAIIQSVTVGATPVFPLFDGTNIWVPNAVSNTVTVVRTSTAAVIATLTFNGMEGPLSAAFDGERVLVANNGNGRVSLWKAADLSPLGFVGIGSTSFPHGVCSDGVSFWITLEGPDQLVRF